MITHIKRNATVRELLLFSYISLVHLAKALAFLIFNEFGWLKEHYEIQVNNFKFFTTQTACSKVDSLHISFTLTCFRTYNRV